MPPLRCRIRAGVGRPSTIQTITCLSSLLRDTLAGLAVGAGLKWVVDQSSDLNESTNVTGLIFKDARGEIDKFVESSYKLGFSEAQARELTGSVGGLLANLGLAQDETVEWSKRLLTLGADMGSAFNANPAEAVEAIATVEPVGEQLRCRANPVVDQRPDSLRVVPDLVVLGPGHGDDDLLGAAWWLRRGRLSFTIHQPGVRSRIHLGILFCGKKKGSSAESVGA